MMTDRQFAKSFFKMIFFLGLLTITLIAAGIVIGGSIDDKLRAQSEEYTQRIIAQRTQPVGTLNVGAMEPSVEPTTPVQVASSANTGKSVYDKACFICHATGLTGAPKPGDADNWAPRIAKGLDTLYSNAINGYQGKTGIMPPKGGNLLLSDEDVKAAIDYLVGLVQ